MCRYTVKKVDVSTEIETNYGGGYSVEDVSDITKGYVFNGLFYERKGSRYICNRGNLGGRKEENNDSIQKF